MIDLIGDKASTVTPGRPFPVGRSGGQGPGPVTFAWEIAKANVIHTEPDIGGRASPPQ